ncbi:MAG: HindIII family type II restriction endonuclease [Clostridiales bacterium]|nr:HindIII family type II restriction endonuclease [Clostridiales bacterium]
MKLSNVFYFKHMVDYYYPDEDKSAVKIKTVIKKEQENIKLISDEDFTEIMICCFIPDLYSGMGKREKLFTKFTELMVGEWWRRMGGTYCLPTKKSGTQDVELIYDKISIVCDAKVFRLGRSQKAPNVKDFLKLASVGLWIDKLNADYREKGIKRSAIGGLVTYSSLHEWESDSEVYEECTNRHTPVVMLPYEILSLLLKYKKRVRLSDLIKMWDYSANGVKPSRQKDYYWSYVTNFICRLLSISNEQYQLEMKQFRNDIMIAVQEYRKIIDDTIEEVKRNISHDIDNHSSSMESLKIYIMKELEKRDNATARSYLAHIENFRHYEDN